MRRAVDTRFDNVATADLLAREMEARFEAEALKRAVAERLVAESGIEIGAVYLVKNDGLFLAGRKLLVEGVVSGIPDSLHKMPFVTKAWGRLNGKSAAGDGWTIRRQQVAVERLEKAK